MGSEEPVGRCERLDDLGRLLTAARERRMTQADLSELDDWVTCHGRKLLGLVKEVLSLKAPPDPALETRALVEHMHGLSAAVSQLRSYRMR